MIRESLRIMFARRRFLIIVVIYIFLNALFTYTSISTSQKQLSLNPYPYVKFAVIPSIASLMLSDVFFILTIFLSDIISEEKNFARVVFLKSLFKNNIKRYLSSKVLSAIILMSALSIALSVTIVGVVNYYLVGLSFMQMLEISLILSITLIVINIQMVGIGSLFSDPRISIVFNFIFYSLFYNGIILNIIGTHYLSYYYLDLGNLIEFLIIKTIEKQSISEIFAVWGYKVPPHQVTISLTWATIGILINLVIGVIPIVYNVIKIVGKKED